MNSNVKIVDEFEIKIDFVLKGDLLAKVKLNLFNQVEIRYNRITLNNAGDIWFQPPKLVNPYTRASIPCFAVIDISEYKKLEKRVIDEFKSQLSKRIEDGVYREDVLDKLIEAKQKKDEEIIIPDDFGNA